MLFSMGPGGRQVPEVAPPPLPPGRTLDLPGRGTTFVRELAGPPGAPALVLLHGLGATADVNWFTAFRPLSRYFRILAIDHRGHGRGIRSRRRFRLADCADDAVAAARACGIDRFIAVGYSMGGPIAQLIAHRHPDAVEGLVLCATSRNFRGKPHERLMFATMPVVGLASRVPTSGAIRQALQSRLVPALPGRLGAWMTSELRLADSRMLLEAVDALGRFSSHDWVGSLDLPVSVLIHTQDQLVPPNRQVKLAASIPGAVSHFVHADHYAAGLAASAFVPKLVDACKLVGWRAGHKHLLPNLKSLPADGTFTTLAG